MRLRRLLLSRYGLFSDHEIDFGEAVEGEPDLHVIYGPNEAGKSTALAGFLDLLFTFEHRSRYGFRHGYDAMRVEADIELGNKTHRFARIRKRQGSLLDDKGRQVPEGLLANARGSMSNRETYKAMFSLDDDTLESGGEDILRSEGELGRLLFATGAGLSKLSGTLKGLLGTAEEFHRGRARKTNLYALKGCLKGIEDEKKKCDMTANTYAGLVKERDRAKTAYDEAAAALARLKAEHVKKKRHLRGLDWLAKIQSLRTELANLDSLPEPPQIWFEQINDLIDRVPSLIAEIKGLEKRKHELEEERGALAVDDAILAQEDRIDRLKEPSARYVTAANDLPRRNRELNQYRGEIEAILRRLERTPDTDPSALTIPAAVTGALQNRMEQRSGIDERVRTTKGELDRAEVEAREARLTFGGVDVSAEAGDEAAYKHLENVLAEVRSDDWRARLNLCIEQRDRLKADLGRRMAQLHPWNGGAEGLAEVQVPEAEEVETWKAALGETGKKIERLEADRARLLAECGRHDAQAKARKEETGVVDDEEAAQLRAARNQAWQRHRAALESASADAFESRMKAYDSASDGRLTQATALASIRQASEALRATKLEIERNAEECAQAHQQRQQVLNEIAAAAQIMIATGAADLPPDITCAKLTGWLERRRNILAIAEDIEREDVDIGKARRDGEQHRKRLDDALAAAGIETEATVETEQLVTAAQAAVTQAAAMRQRLAQAQSNLQNRHNDAKQADSDDETWRSHWTDTLSRCWLGGIAPEPSAPAVRRILAEVTKLDTAHREYEKLAGRISDMEQDQAKFVAEVELLVEELGDSFNPAQAVAQFDGLRSHLAEAKTARDRRGELQKKLEQVCEELTQTENKKADLRAVADDMFKAFGVDSLLAVKEKLQQVERRVELRGNLAESERQLMDTMKAGSLKEAETLLEGADRSAIEDEIARIDEQIGDAEGHKQDRNYAFRKAEDAIVAVGGDNAAAQLEQQRRTILLEIEEHALAYLRVRLGVAAAENALRAYRDAHRSSMMENASRAFATISRGAYARLASQPGDKGEVLIGIPADGSAKLAHEMSKGTRFQLYLALRVAGYREFVRQHGPVPFFADDILETFDDFRAEETFRVFADMARSGQTIYLSHHRHLCDIAQQVCPGVTLHQLPDPVAAAAGSPAGA